MLKFTLGPRDNDDYWRLMARQILQEAKDTGEGRVRNLYELDYLIELLKDEGLEAEFLRPGRDSLRLDLVEGMRERGLDPRPNQ